MPLSQNQINTVASQLAVNLSQVSTDRLVELCLLYRSCPDALPSFVTALKNEIIRRFTPEKIAENDTLFAVLQNFANQFASPIPYAHHQLLQMAETVNTDIWFVDNEQAFNAFINDTQVMTWLVKQLDLMDKILQNQFGLRWVASSTVASTAILTDGDAVVAWKQAPNLWRIWTQQQEGMTVLAKSSELMAWAADLDDAMTAVANSSTAMTAVLASSTAMAAVAASSTAMAAVAASSTARDAFFANNNNFQNIRTELYKMVKVHWKKQAQTTQDGVSNANNAMAQKMGLVFACLGFYGSRSSAKTSMFHKNGTLVAQNGSTSNPQSMASIDGVSFEGATFTEQGDGYVYCELWVPK